MARLDLHGVPEPALTDELTLRPVRRLEDDGLIRRYRNHVDARYIDVRLSRAGATIAPAVTDLIHELEVDVHESAGGPARGGFHRVASMLAAMDEEAGY